MDIRNKRLKGKTVVLSNGIIGKVKKQQKQYTTRYLNLDFDEDCRSFNSEIFLNEDWDYHYWSVDQDTNGSVSLGAKQSPFTPLYVDCILD